MSAAAALGLAEELGQSGESSAKGSNRVIGPVLGIRGENRMSLRHVGTRSICVLTIALVAGCGSDRDVKTEPSASPTVSVAPSPVDENAAILAAYREFFARQAEISAAPKEERRGLLEPFTTNPALQRVLGGMFAAEEYGEVGYGAPIVNPKVQKIDGDTATVHDCQDGRKAGRKKRDSGKITTRGIKNAKVVATLERGADGRWRMATIESPDEPC